MSIDTIKQQALAAISTLENKAVAEYLTLKTGHYSLAVVGIAFAVGVVLGLVL